MRFMSRLMLVAGTALLLLVVIAPASAVTWEMAGPLPASNFLTQNVDGFVKNVAHLSGGKFKINLHVSGELIKPQETKQAVRSGQIPIAQMYLYVYGNENPAFETSTIPFIAGTYIKSWKMWKVTKPYMEKILAKQRMKILYAVPWPIQGFYTRKSIQSMADFKNVKFRVYSTMTARMAKLMGAEPVQIQFGEIAQAFATGLVGAMYTSPQTGINSQAWDFAKHFTNTYGGNLSMTAVVVNAKEYKGLDPDLKQVLHDAALDAQTSGWLTAEAISTEHIAILKKNGMIIEEPSPEFRKNLNKIGRQMLEEWAKTAGPLGVEVLEAFK